MNTYLLINTDGGSRGNPGPGALGVCIEDTTGTVLATIGRTLGITTNNVAEYQAVVAAFDWLLENGEVVSRYERIRFAMDSLLVCSQINGVYKIKSSHLALLLSSIKVKQQELLRKQAITISFTHVPRKENTCADALVNKALDHEM